MRCDGCHDLVTDRAGMKRCKVARGKPTDDIRVCVWAGDFMLKREHGNGMLSNGVS